MYAPGALSLTSLGHHLRGSARGCASCATRRPTQGKKAFSVRRFQWTARMSLAVMESKESKEAELERVVEYRAGWLYMNYKHRGTDLEKLNVVEYADKIGMPVMPS